MGHFKSVKQGIIYLSILVLAGCGTFGASYLPSNHQAFNESATEANNAQLLLNLVRLRYNEPTYFLQVTNITTQMSRAVNAGYNYDIISGTAQLATAIEQTLTSSISQIERPTISYHPLNGANYLKRSLRPLSFDEIFQFIQAGWPLSRVLRITIQSAGPIHNAMYSNQPVGPYIPKDYEVYRRISREFSRLDSEKLLTYRLVKVKKSPYIEIIVDGGLPQNLAKDLKLPPHTHKFLIGSNKAPTSIPTLVVKTRSMMEIMYYLSKGIEVPKAHLQQHFVKESHLSDNKPFNWTDTTKYVMHIKSSKRAPRNYFVRVYYNGYWFFIPKSFDNSKQSFSFIQSLFPIVIHDSGKNKPTYTLAL